MCGGVFAEFERSTIVEGVNAGVRRAQVHGTKSGKPIGRPPLAAERDAAIRASLAAGVGIVKTARLHKTCFSVVQRIRSEIAAAAEWRSATGRAEIAAIGPEKHFQPGEASSPQISQVHHRRCDG